MGSILYSAHQLLLSLKLEAKESMCFQSKRDATANELGFFEEKIMAFLDERTEPAFFMLFGSERM